MLDVGVALGIKGLVVDPVQDPVQLVGVAAQQLIEALAKLRRLDLLGVALADSVHDVREVDAAAQEVDDVVEARDAQPDQSPLLQARENQGAKTEHALRRQVVNGQGGRDLAVRIAVVDTVKHVGDQGRVPVVDVNHIGEEIQGGHHLEHGAAEVDRPRVVVPEAEHPVAVVELRAVDEIDDHLAEPAFEDGRRQLVAPQGHLEVGYDGSQAVAPNVDLPIAGQDDAHVVAQAAQLLGQGGGHVRHAAELCERRQLRGRDQDLEVLRVRHLYLRRLAGDTQAEGARRRHHLHVAALSADDQRHLERISRALADLWEGNRDGEWILDVPARLRGCPRQRFDDLRHRDLAALRPRRDPDHVSRLETKLGDRCLGQRKLHIAVAVQRRRPRAVKPELDLLGLELVTRARRVDPEIHLAFVVPVIDALDHTRRTVQGPKP